MLPLAHEAEEGRRRAEEGSAAAVRRLASETRGYREALVNGQAPPARLPETTLLLARSLRQQQAAAADRRVPSLARRLAGIFSPQQVQAAFLLALGRTPPDVRPSPVLLDAESGFSPRDFEQDDWRRAVTRRRLLRIYPPQLVGAFFNPWFTEVNGNVDGPPQTGSPEEQALAEILIRYPREMRRAMMLDSSRLRETWRKLPGRLLEGAGIEERPLALEPLVRHMFLSPRLTTVLREGLLAADAP